MELKPVGQRPKCLCCKKELRPKYNRASPPLNVQTDQEVSVRTTKSFATGTPEYEQLRTSRPTTEAERKQWRKEHPPEFLGKYGAYGDNRFCGLNCGYNWAVRNTNPVS